MRTKYEQRIITPMLSLYKLSKIIPVRMKSCYGTSDGEERATWWQWRGRVWSHRTFKEEGV